MPPSRFLVLSDEFVDTTDPVTYRVVDAVTGEAVDTLPDISLAELEGHVSLGRNALAISEDGDTMVIGFSAAQLWLLREVEGEPELRQLTSPPGLAEAISGSVDLFLSPDGSMLSLTLNGDETRTRWLLPLDGATDAWIEVPSTVPGEGRGTIFFVPGTGS